MKWFTFWFSIITAGCLIIAGAVPDIRGEVLILAGIMFLVTTAIAVLEKE